MKNLQKLFFDQLSDIYYVENQQCKVLPKWVKAVTCEKLQRLFQGHLAESEGHVIHLEKVFEAFGRLPRKKKCEGVTGILKEGGALLSDFKASSAINAAMVAVAQKMEHYEISTYGCLVEWAYVLDNSRAARILSQILEEEKTADLKLTDLAREECNRMALGEEESSVWETEKAEPLGVF